MPDTAEIWALNNQLFHLMMANLELEPIQNPVINALGFIQNRGNFKNPLFSILIEGGNELQRWIP